MSAANSQVELTALDRIRMARGLLRHYERDETYHRGVVSSLTSHYSRKHEPNGACLWCGQPTKNKRTTWHSRCATAYQIAKGQTSAFGSPLISRYRDGARQKRHVTREDFIECEICGEPGAELDHRLALSIAHRLGRRAELRAYWIDNLRWLCRSCHLVKTAADRRALARLSEPRPDCEQGELFDGGNQ